MAEGTMSEPALDVPSAEETQTLRRAAREFDLARMRKIGGFHFALVMGALTMWGAAETWAQTTGWGLAHAVAIANAVVAGFVIPSTIHEWGHFAGARISGAVSPVLDEARGHFFLFDFPMDQNDTQQFSWMSWGGIVAPWVAVLLAAMFVPLSLTSGAVLFATLVSKAVATSAFEVPIVRAAEQGTSPGRALNAAVRAGTLPRSRNIGMIAGVVCFALVWMIA